MLRLPEEASQEVRVAVALGVLEAHVERPHERFAGGGEVAGHVPVIVLIDGYGGCGVGGEDHADSLLRSRFPDCAAHLVGDRDELVTLTGPHRYVADLHGPPLYPPAIGGQLKPFALETSPACFPAAAVRFQLDSERFQQPGETLEGEIPLPSRPRTILAGLDLDPLEPRRPRPGYVRLRIIPYHRDFVRPEPQVLDGEPEEVLLGLAYDGRARAARILQGGDERSGVQREPVLFAPVTVFLQREKFCAVHEAAERGVQAVVGEAFPEVSNQHVVRTVFGERDTFEVFQQGLVYQREAAPVRDQTGRGPGGREDLRLLDFEA